LRLNDAQQAVSDTQTYGMNDVGLSDPEDPIRDTQVALCAAASRALRLRQHKEKVKRNPFSNRTK
jgi:hypothetical protein